MSEMRTTGRSSWLWMAVILALLVVLVVWFFGPVGDAGSQQAAAPEVESTDFVAENPTEPAVPVTLPDTPMTSLPESAAPPAE